MADFTSVTQLSGPSGRERYTLAGAEGSRPATIPASYLPLRAPPALRTYALVTKALRVLVRALFLSPLLILAKVILYVMNVPAGDYITLAFVLVVVTLFGVFAIVMLFIAVIGPRSTRTLARVFAPPRAQDATAIIAQEVPQASVRVAGRIDAGVGSGQIVVDDRWGDDAGTIVRVFEGSSFVVFPDDGAPIIVELEACPIVVAPRADDAATLVPGIGAFTPLARFVLRQGDRVEVIAAEGRPGTHPVLQTAESAAPYREAESSATAVTSRPSAPVVLRAVG